MDEANDVIRALQAMIAEARSKNLKNVILKDYLKGSELLWFLNYKTVVKTNFLLFENSCNLRFVRHRGGWEVFFDEKKITSAVPDNIFDIYVQKHFKTNHESILHEDRPPSPKPLLQRRLKCEGFLTGDRSVLNTCALEEFDYFDGAYRSKSCLLNDTKYTRWCENCSIIKKNIGRYRKKYVPISDVKKKKC